MKGREEVTPRKNEREALSPLLFDFKSYITLWTSVHGSIY
jgi:hypothetical protein